MFEYIVVLKMQVNIKVDTRANKIGIVLLVIVLGCCALYIQHNTLLLMYRALFAHRSLKSFLPSIKA